MEGAGSLAAADIELRVFGDPEELASALARALTDELERSVKERGRFTLALTGGRSPLSLYRRLARDHRDLVPWTEVHLFWSDERHVPRDHPESNVRAALELLRPLPLVEENIHAPDTTLPLEEAARLYERELSKFHPLDTFVLGLGPDGHVASLFPGRAELEERARLVLPVRGAPKPPPDRLTMTFPAIDAGGTVHLLVTGADKQDAFERLKKGDRTLPARRLRSREGKIFIWRSLDPNP
jgi:6-phosphogluconolactonase